MEYNEINLKELTMYLDVFDTDYMNENYDYFGCMDGSIPAGVIALEKTGKKGSITWIYVAPDYRNKGIGRELLKHGISQYKKLGVDIITAEFLAGEGDPQILHRFFEMQGFEGRYVRIPYYVVTTDKIRENLKKAKTGKKLDNSLKVLSLSDLPKGMLSNMLKTAEKRGNYLLSRYDFMECDAHRTFFLVSDDKVQGVIASKTKESLEDIEIDLVVNLLHNGSSPMELLLFFTEALAKLDDLPVNTQTVSFHCVSEPALKMAEYFFGKKDRQFTEHISEIAYL